MAKGLKLKAECVDDLAVLSAALQDAIGQVGDIRFDSRARSLTLRVSRFQHERQKTSRVLTGIRIDSVLGVKARGIDRKDPTAMIVILALEFETHPKNPSGILRIILAGDGEFAVDVECIDIIMADVSAPRNTNKRPLHPLDDSVS